MCVNLRFTHTQHPRHCALLIHAKRASVQVELDFYVTLGFAAGLPTLPPVSSSELASYPFLGQKSVCIQPHRFEFSIAAGLDLDVEFVAAGDVWGYNLPLYDLTIFHVPVYLVCFSPQCQPGNFDDSSGTVPKRGPLTRVGRVARGPTRRAPGGDAGRQFRPGPRGAGRRSASPSAPARPARKMGAARPGPASRAIHFLLEARRSAAFKARSCSCFLGLSLTPRLCGGGRVPPLPPRIVLFEQRFVLMIWARPLSPGEEL